MKTFKHIAFALVACLAAACADTEWDAPAIQASQVCGNNSITEDNIITIAELKAKYPNVFSAVDKNMLVEEDVKIKARVTANDIRGNIYKQIVVQDETGAIIVAVNEGGISGYLAEGQEIILALKGLYIGGYCKMPEIGMPYNGNSIGRMTKETFQDHFKVVGTPDPTAIQPIDFDLNMNIDENCGKLVTLRNVEFLDANGKATYAPGDSSVAIVGGCVNRPLIGMPDTKIVIRTSTYAKFAADKLPYDDVNKRRVKCDITGIATRYFKASNSGADKDTWQILIRKEADVKPVEE